MTWALSGPKPVSSGAFCQWRLCYVPCKCCTVCHYSCQQSNPGPSVHSVRSQCLLCRLSHPGPSTVKYKWSEDWILADSLGSVQKRENWWSSKNSTTVVLPESDVWLSVFHLLVLEVELRAAVVTTADTNRKRWLDWYIEVQSNLRALSLCFPCSEIAKCHSVGGARSHSLYICMHTQTLTWTLFLAQLIRGCRLRDEISIGCVKIYVYLFLSHVTWTCSSPSASEPAGPMQQVLLTSEAISDLSERNSLGHTLSVLRPTQNV
jgi:hypothetical protein